MFASKVSREQQTQFHHMMNRTDFSIVPGRSFARCNCTQISLEIFTQSKVQQAHAVPYMPKVCVDVCVCLCISKAVSAPGVYTPPTGPLFKGVSGSTMPPPACGCCFLAPGTTKLNKCRLSATPFRSCQTATRVKMLRQTETKQPLNLKCIFLS